ncbi:MAG: CoB--CoM heterodisulfide reductase iron-sulfur subunit A family protein [Planctomycetota bacterium]
MVVAGCSPREHENTFRGVLERAGMNPYLLQLVNIREHVAWVLSDPRQATEKAALYIRAAIERVKLQEPLQKTTLDVNLRTLVLGSGPAGLKAALTLAEAGREVVLVEKRPTIGGWPVLFDEVFPSLECGPCVLEPLMGEVLQGPHAEKIELLTLSQVTEVLGYYGNFKVKIHKLPRYVDTRTCIGCGMCLAGCPASGPDPLSFGLGERKAIALAFVGSLPNVPFIDPAACLRLNGRQECALCQASCPIEGAINFNDGAQDLEREVGAIVAATGGALYDCARLPNLGLGRVRNVVHSLQFERLASPNGPTGGKLLTAEGHPPKRVAIIHCVGSLDSGHRPYCSAVCCASAFKFNRLIQEQTPGTEITHYWKGLCVPGKRGHTLYEEALHDPRTRLVHYTDISQLDVANAAGGVAVRCSAGNGSAGVPPAQAKAGGTPALPVLGGAPAPQKPEAALFDLVVLCPALVPGPDTAQLARLLEAGTDRTGFFEERHGLVQSSKAKVRGVYLSGTCRAPMNIQEAATEGEAAAGNVLAALVAGRKLEIEPVVASVDAERCSGCMCCVPVCPYKAIRREPEKGKAEINAVLCSGCGTCVASCPIGAIRGAHFTNAQIMAELKGVLA